jgi:hypothetical protein
MRPSREATAKADMRFLLHTDSNSAAPLLSLEAGNDTGRLGSPAESRSVP